MTVLCQYRFRMKLHPFDGQLPMTDAHNFPDTAIGILGPGCDFQTVRQTALLQHQRMITCGLKRAGQAVKYASVIMVHPRGLAMHDSAGMDDPTAKGLADALVTEANTKNGHLPGEMGNGCQRNTGLIGITGTR